MTTRVQNQGIARITALLAAVGWYFQWGTGSGAAASANAVTGTAEARAGAGVSLATVSIANDQLVTNAILVASGGRTITEVGVFDSPGAGSPPVGGNMDLYGDFSAVLLSAGDSIAFTAKVQFA